ncbi:MAG: ATP-binding protein [Bacillota bacterium]|nr:ATP-binding protein [Bacillota bacterium]
MNKVTKNNDSYYKLIFENNPVMQILFNRHDLQIIDANKAARDFFWDVGYSCKSESITKIIPQDTLRLITTHIKNLSEAKSEKILINLEKGVGDFNLLLELSFVLPGDADLLLSFTNTADYLNAAESRLESSENNLPDFLHDTNSVSKSLNTVIFQVDKRGMIITSEGHGLDKVSLKDRLLTGSSIFEVCNNYPDFINFIKRSLLGENIISSLNLNGITFEIIITPLKGANGYINGAVCFVTDITDRKRTEAALELSEAKYSTLVENTSDIMFSYDDKGVFTYISNSVTRFGYQVDEVIGKRVMDFIYKEDREYVYKEIRNALSSLESMVLRIFRIRLKDNSYIVVEEIAKRILDESGKIVLITGILRDISDRKKNLELVQKIEQNNLLLREAKEYNKLKTEFFANISHEFRTPLSVIMATLQLFKLIVKKSCAHCEQTEKFNDYFYAIKQNCYRLTRLVNNLLDITRIDSDFYVINLQNNNIVKIIENIVLSITEFVENKGLTIDLIKAEDAIITACDPDKVERIMLNLISNAIKFNSEGGKITIEIKRINEDIQISVIDTGIGIPSDKLSVIFERFRQIDKSLTRNYEGSGIGLSLVKSLVEMHKGKIYVESKYGYGSKFVINLPQTYVNSKEIHENNYDKKRDVQIERIHIEFSDIYMK